MTADSVAPPRLPIVGLPNELLCAPQRRGRSLPGRVFGQDAQLTLGRYIGLYSFSGWRGSPCYRYDGAVLLGSSAVSGGKATFTTSSLAVGTHTLTASYSGDSTFMPSTSTAVSVQVALTTAVNVVVRDTAGNLTTLALPLSIR